MEVTTKEPLICGPTQRMAAFRDCTIFLCLDELVKPPLPGAVGHNAPGIFIDDLHFAVSDDVLHVATEKMKCGKRLLNQLFSRATNGPQSLQARGKFRHSALAVRSQPYRLLACQYMKILFRHQPAREIQRGLIQSSIVFGFARHTGQDQRCSRLVDEDTVRLIDDGEMQTAQEQTLRLAG